MPCGKASNIGGVPKNAGHEVKVYELLLDLELNRQPMAIPSESSLDMESVCVRISGDNVFDCSGLHQTRLYDYSLNSHDRPQTAGVVPECVHNAAFQSRTEDRRRR